MGDVDITKVRWQCRRGMLELDLILQNFFENNYAQLSQEDQNTFVRLLEEPDPVLYQWLLGTEEPENLEFQRMIQMIKENSAK